MSHLNSMKLMCCVMLASSVAVEAQRETRANSSVPSSTSPDKTSVNNEALKDWTMSQFAPNNEQFWTSVKNLDVALGAIQRFGEPLTVPALDALERLMPEKTSIQGIRASALLYRYNRPQGLVYLREALKTKDETVGNVLVLNKEQEYLGQVLNILKATPDLESREFALALGRWNRPEISRALLDAFKSAPENVNLALSLSWQHLSAAKPYIRRLFNSVPNNDTAKEDITAAMINIDPQGSADLLTQLINRLNGKEKAFSHLRIIESLGKIEQPESQVALKNVVKLYLREGDRPVQKNPDGSIEQSLNSERAILAALNLDVSLEGNIELLKSLLVKMQLAKLPTKSVASVARQILSKSEQNARKFLIERMGDDWVKREERKKV